VRLSEIRSGTRAILDFNAHYHNGALKCGSIPKRWLKWFHYIFKMALKNDPCVIYSAGSYYGIRCVTQFLSFSSHASFYSTYRFPSYFFRSFLFFFFSTTDQKNGLGWHNLSTCSLRKAYLMLKYKIRLSLESYRRQKYFSVPTAKFLFIPSETHNTDFRNVSRNNIINSSK
jgi:hypothetical protein